MSSLISGYEYDIFISYRQKDNKGDRWVSEFVEALKTELESTFKEEISVYFDINPHDGLLETHDVYASLKDKLKCLVFIPIISHTYCDPKSFAWEHEFKAFVEQASKDQFGLKIKLPNGNVASRVLPIQIHDLKPEDKALVEQVLEGFIRAIEFIYKEPGVNRPLTVKDSEEKNINHTNYRNQINKVANSIEEIISGLKTGPIEVVKEKPLQREPLQEAPEEQDIVTQEKPFKSVLSKLFPVILIITILVIAAILTYPKIFKRDTLNKLKSSGERISIAVVPFQNLTNDTIIWNIYQEIIQNNLTAYLSYYSKDLQVRQTESINSILQSKGLTNYASVTPSLASTVSQKLDADIFIYGKIIKSGNAIRLSAQLIDTKTEEIIKSFQIGSSSKEENFLPIIDSLSTMIRDFLIISVMEKEIPMDFQQIISTNSSDAYRYYMYGHKAHYKLDYPAARDWFLRAIGADSNFIGAITMLSYAYGNDGMTREAQKWCLKAYGKKNLTSDQQRLFVELAYTTYFGTPYDEIKYAKQLIELDDQSPTFYRRLGAGYNQLDQNEKGISAFEKVFELYNKWGIKPMWILDYTVLGKAYHRIGKYNKEKELYKRAEQDFPDDPSLIYRQAILALTEGDTNEANQYIEKYLSIRKENSASEAEIAKSLAGIYYEAVNLDKTEGYYQQALSLEPEDPVSMNNLAYFLIDKNRNINEGLELVNKALKISPDDYSYLQTKGWGLYKQGKLQEALDILQKSWDLRRQYSVYNHEAFLHLEAAKKAVANQKNN